MVNVIVSNTCLLYIGQISARDSTRHLIFLGVRTYVRTCIYKINASLNSMLFLATLEGYHTVNSGV